MFKNIIKNTVLIIIVIFSTTQNNFLTNKEIFNITNNIENFPTVERLKQIFSTEPDGFAKHSFDIYSKDDIEKYKEKTITVLELFHSEETSLDQSFSLIYKMFNLFDILGTLYKDAELFAKALSAYLNSKK
jgi:hypothetical protein